MSANVERAHWTVDVAVVGGGPAGIAAALAAARNGAQTVLIERYGFVGGNLTMGLPMYSFHDLRGRQVLGGLAFELVHRLQQSGGAIGPLRNWKGSLAFLDPEQVKATSLTLLREAGVTVLLHSQVVGVAQEAGRIVELTVQGKDGCDAVRAAVTVDATGDGDVAALARCPFEMGDENGSLQPATLMFVMGGVDTERIRQLAVAAPQACQTRMPASNFAEPHYIFAGFRAALQRAKDEGFLPADYPADVVIFSTLPTPGHVALNLAKITGIDGTRSEDLTRGEAAARQDIPKLVAVLRSYAVGFEAAYLVSTAHQLGIRETRRILGEYVLTADDILHGTVFDDSIALAFYPIDIHRPQGGGAVILDIEEPYTIPYRCLVPRQGDNLLVAGRCISCTHEAQGSIRVMGTCMATGQAAGTAAALSVHAGLLPRNVDVSVLQCTLREQEAILLP